MTDNTTPASRGPIPGFVVGQYFGIFDGIPKQDYEKIVAEAPFDKCNLLILAFVRTVSEGKTNVARFTNGRDNNFPLAPDDTDEHRVKLVVDRARARNPSIKILVSLGWSETTNDAGRAAATPGPFADSVAAIVRDHHLDGFDIDYESADASPDAMLTLAQHLRKSLDSITPKREMILTITPAQQGGLDKRVLQAFTYVMPQTYDHGGIYGLTVDWYEQQLGSFDRIVYGLNSEGFVGSSDPSKKPDDPGKSAKLAKRNRAAGIFAWRLDTDNSKPGTHWPTFAAANKMWDLMNPAGAR